MSFFHGIKRNLVATGTRPIMGVAMAVIGMVATAPDADADTFPLGQAALITDVRAAIGKAGTQGTLVKSLEAIADQCSPIIVAVRVAPGVDAAATETAVIAGIAKLLGAEAQLGVRPRILGVPGLDTQDVTTALVAAAAQLRASVYASCDTADTVAEAVLYREEFGARELMLLYPDFKRFAGHAVAAALGVRARIDEETGWHKTLSNVAVNGVSGLSRDIFFDVLDQSNDAGVLNQAPVTALVQMNGYRFWGNRTCSDDPLFAFESTVRTSAALGDSIAQGLIWVIDKPIVPSLVRDILETINHDFRMKKGEGRIIGGEAWFDESQNSPANLAAGKLAIDYDFTPCAPLEGLTLNQRITDRFYAQILSG